MVKFCSVIFLLMWSTSQAAPFSRNHYKNLQSLDFCSSSNYQAVKSWYNEVCISAGIRVSRDSERSCVEKNVKVLENDGSSEGTIQMKLLNCDGRWLGQGNELRSVYEFSCDPSACDYLRTIKDVWRPLDGNELLSSQI